jgi:predicted urease superfamily metal-dependent hydrolase|tara:strand:+ start:2812 stop:2997 length:186 start_codon:yes stop_codon:yes gene_type:complete
MKTIKVMSIIGLVFAGLGIMVFYTMDTDYIDDSEAVAGWLIILSAWLIAQSVTSIVQAKKK